MKKRLLLLCLLFPLLISAQQDFQWMVFDGKLKNGIDYDQVTTNPYIKIDGIKKPYRTNSPLESPTSNDFFIIYEDGSFYLSDRALTVTDVSTSTNDITETSYSFENTIPIKHLYLTNRYEDDDPKALVTTTPSQSSFLESMPPPNAARNNTHGMLTHQSPVIGTDIVFVLNAQSIPDCYYELCINDLQNQLSFQAINFNSTDQETNLNIKNVLVYVNGYFVEKSFFLNQDNCIELGEIQGNTFIKFRVNGDIDSITDGVINYSLIGSKKSCSFNSQDVVDPTGHDPNFVQLKCVWEEGGKYYAKYHVECYNDDRNNSVNLLQMTLDLPTFINPASIKYGDWMVGGKYGCDTILNGKFKQGFVIGQLLKVNFNNGLSVYNDPPSNADLYTGYFEFEAEVTPAQGQNIYTMSLSLNSPVSNFEYEQFPITTFLQQTSCLSSTMIEQIYPGKGTAYEETNSCLQGRTLSNCSTDCQSPPSCSWICWIMWLLGGILVCYLLFMILKKRS